VFLPMKILMVSDVYFPRVNGVSTSIQTFRRELVALGHTIRLIAPAYPAAGIDEPCTHRVPSWQVPFDPEDRLMRPAGVRELAAALEGDRYDLVHIQTPFVAHYAGIALARRLGVPCIETYHTFFEEYLHHYVPALPRSWLRALARRFSRAQGAQVDALVVPSTAMRDALAQYGVRAPMHIIPTGIRAADFAGGDGAAFRRAHDIPASSPLFLFVGRVAHEKNIDFLLHAFAIAARELPGAMLAIAGEGPAVAHLQRLARTLELEPRVRFIGYLDRERALLDCYCSADAFVFASRTETQGLVLLEAMALGVPVISTAVMGTRDIVGPGRGALVPSDNPQDFAQAMLRLARDPALREKLAAEAKAYAAEWLAETMALRLQDLYAATASAYRGNGASLRASAADSASGT
jgi:1,2-diacylglycerol 3-alpha-glucosyltransferase